MKIDFFDFNIKIQFAVIVLIWTLKPLITISLAIALMEGGKISGFISGLIE